MARSGGNRGKDTVSKEAKIIDVQVGQRLRAARLKLKMSQEGLGSRLGLTFQQIQKYEKGINRVSAGRLAQIAEIVEEPINYFFASLGTKGDEMTSAMQATLADRDVMILLGLMGRVGKSGRKTLIAMAQELAG